MTGAMEYLQRLRKINRRSSHQLIHKIHKKHNISKKTLFYIKEYGEHSNVPRTIIKESIKVLLVASVISSLGGLAIEQIKTIFFAITPLVILLPILNDMTGDYGTIVSSRLSTMLHEGRVKKKWWAEYDIRKMFMQILIVAIITTAISFFMALLISHISQNGINVMVASKIFLIAIIDILIIVSILFLISILAGLYFYKRGEDPNNFLIPITTSVADFGNMIILVLLVMLFF